MMKEIKDRIFLESDRILSVKLVFFQPGLFAFSHDGIILQDRILYMIVYFT